MTLLQRNFVSMASHEFRTPLTIIDGHARRLDKIKDTVKPAEIGERAGKIRSAVLRMTHLIDNLLNSSRLIDGGAGLYFHPGRNGYDGVAAGSLPVASRNGAGLADRRAICRGAGADGRRRQAVVSGVQQSPLQRHQIFAGRRHDRGRSRERRRRGRGRRSPTTASAFRRTISPRLFERYHRGSNVSGIVGTGVGLYLVKMAVDLHRGRVEVDEPGRRGLALYHPLAARSRNGERRIARGALPPQ